MEVEDILGSKAKVRILKVLIDREELNISAIAREAGINHRTAMRHLEELKKMGIITEKVFGRVRIFRVNASNIRVEALRKLFKSLGEGLEGKDG